MKCCVNWIHEKQDINKDNQLNNKIQSTVYNLKQMWIQNNCLTKYIHKDEPGKFIIISWSSLCSLHCHFKSIIDDGMNIKYTKCLSYSNQKKKEDYICVTLWGLGIVLHQNDCNSKLNVWLYNAKAPVKKWCPVRQEFETLRHRESISSAHSC